MTLNSILLLFNLGTGEIVIIALVVLLLFGGRKIPELMKGLGKGVRGFKEGLNDIQDEINRPVNELDEQNAKKEAERREQKENRLK
ncbi:MAG: twin-arginine translocase TatA/TatE family subunit [Bacteroidales bacterium]|nr:twin-arginine translocase TatA/TatE family subunit [Bacteroidales bacterium]MDY3911637.1 twin-arginine translocase TatA/TatE family subunit [Sodaliphilus sp.]